MAFNINAHVILSGPKNIKAVTKSIQKQLGGISTKINVQVPKNINRQMGAFSKRLQTLHKDLRNVQGSAAGATSALRDLGTQVQALNSSTAGLAKSQSRVQGALQNTGKNVRQVGNEIQEFGKDAALAIRRFAAFTVATGVVFGFVRAIQSATKAALDYEREITKVVQVTGASAGSISKLKATIDDLSNSLGVDANELAALSRTFAQTGQSIDQVRASIRAVARSSLAPSFGEMKNTAEGLIAALAQFNIAAKDSEAILSSINAVSKKFAVEAEDLVSVIRRAGGVFSQAAGNFDDPKKSLNELIGIFTAVRSTTRESADTIAVGLRTIFTRIQRRGTIDFLKQFNIELVDAKGNFVGLFPAFQKLSQGLGDIIRQGDALTLSAITEELGGVRQVGKLIPAITQFNKALAATKIAGEAAKEGLGKDVALALQPLGKQFEQLQKRFFTLIRTISESNTFQNLAKVALSLGNAFLTVAETLKPLLPLITTFAAVKISKGVFDFGKGFVGGLRRGRGTEGLGETIGGAATGGTGRDRDARASAAQQALTNAVKSNSILLGTNNTALQNLTSKMTSNSAALTGVTSRITSTSTQIVGAVGNLINALNRAGGGFGGGGRRPRRFARGGLVPGTGNTDTVPAMLQPGEFVMRKSSVGKLGSSTLDSMNSNKFASGGKASDFMASRHLVGERDFTFSKPKGTKFKKTGGKDKNRFNAKDKFSYARQRDTSINVNSLYRTEQEQKDPNYRAYKDASSPQKRGLKFEKILLAKGLVSELSKSPTSRLDATTPEGTAAEIKSELEALSEARLSEKMIGAALKGKDSIEKKVQANLTNTALTAARNTIGLGAVEVFQDTTGGLGKPRAKKPRRRKFAAGGVVTSGRGFYGIKPAGTGRLTSPQLEAATDEDLSNALQHPSVVNNMAAQGAIEKEQKKRDKQKKGIQLRSGKVGGLFLEKGKKATSTSLKSNFPKGTLRPPFSNVQQLTGSIGAYTLRSKASSAVKDQALPMLENAIGAASEAVVKSFEIPRLANVNEKDLAAQAAGRVDLNAITGHLFEGFTSAVAQAPLTESKSLFDFMSPSAESLLAMGKIFQPSSITERLLEAKKLLSYDSIGSRSKDNSILNKVIGGANAGILKKSDFNDYMFAAAGGSVFKPKGTDTVPAMLTPGEFVINKKSAESIGYDKLGRMNRYYAKGGVAAKGNMMQYFDDGSTDDPPEGDSADTERTARARVVGGLTEMVGAIGGITAAFASFDAENPLPSIIAMGYAASAAANALTAFAGMQAFDNFKDTLMGFELAGLMGGSSIGDVFNKEVGKLRDAPKKLNKAFSNATRRFRHLRTGAGGLPAQGVVKSAAGALGKFTKSLGGIPKILKGAFTGLPGLITALIAKPLIDAIAGGVTGFFLGEKETIKGTDVTGFRGASAGAGAAAGAAGAAGGAAATALGAAAFASILAPPLAPLIVTLGLLAGAFQLLKGGVIGFFKQLEFNAFIELKDSAETLGKTLKNFEKLDIAGPAGLAKVNKDLEKTLANTNRAIDAGINRQLVESMFSFSSMLQMGAQLGGGALTDLGAAADIAAIGLEAVGASAATTSVLTGRTSAQGRQNALDDQLARIGASEQGWIAMFANVADSSTLASSAMDGFSRVDPSVLIGALSPVAGLISGISHLLGGPDLGRGAVESAQGLLTQEAQKGRKQTSIDIGFGKIAAIALKQASDQITPETFEGIEKALNKSMSGLFKEISALGDKSALQAIAGLQVVSEDLSEEKSAALVTESFLTLTDTLNGALGPTNAFGKELNRLASNAVKVKLLKSVSDQLQILREAGDAGQESAGKLSRAFLDLQKEAAYAKGDIAGIEVAIDAMQGVSGETKAELKALVTAEKSHVVEMAAQIAVQQQMTDAAKAARKAIDALAAGMQQFAAKMAGTADQANLLASQISDEFSQITGEKLVGKLENFNPFTNVAAATDAQIDAAVNQLKGLGTQEEGAQAFREMADLVKGQRDFPNVLRDVFNKITLETQPGEKIDNEQFLSAVEEGLREAGVTLPEKSKEALRSTLRAQGGEGVSRQGAKLAFTLDRVRLLLEEEGDVLKLLKNVSEETVKSLGAAFKSLNQFRNALGKVAAVQQQIAKHRLSAELEMLSKQESIRDRINNALGKLPASLAQATGDLRNRLKTVVGAGLQGQSVLGTTFQGDVLDPKALFERLGDVERARDERRKALGITPGQTIADAAESTMTAADIERNTKELQKLNSESNGLKQALKELGNDTRRLAAIENKLATERTREQGALGTLTSMISAVDKLERGEMSPEEFNKQMFEPIDSLERAFGGGQLSLKEAVGLMQRLQTNDPLVTGLLDVKARQTAAARAADDPTLDPNDPQLIADIKKELLTTLTTKATARAAASAEAGGLPGFAEKMKQVAAAFIQSQENQQARANEMRDIGREQNDILQRTMQEEHNQLEAILQTADKGFQRAALDFQDAVSEFATMRGGVQQNDVDREQANLQNAQKELQTAQSRVAQLKTKEQEGFASEEAKQENSRNLRDARREVEVQEEVVRRAEKRLSHTKNLKQNADRERASRDKEERDRKAAASPETPPESEAPRAEAEEEERQRTETDDLLPIRREQTGSEWDQQRRYATRRDPSISTAPDLSKAQEALEKEADDLGSQTLDNLRKKARRMRVSTTQKVDRGETMFGQLNVPKSSMPRFGLPIPQERLNKTDLIAKIQNEKVRREHEQTTGQSREQTKNVRLVELKQQLLEEEAGEVSQGAHLPALGEISRRAQRKRPAGAIASDGAASIVAAIGGCCQLTVNRLDEIIRVLGGDLSLVSSTEEMSPAEYNKHLQNLISQGMPGVATKLEKVKKERDAEFARRQEEAPSLAAESRGVSPIPEASIKKVGLLGALDTLNKTAKAILTCLCGDIFPEIAKTASNGVAQQAAAKETAAEATERGDETKDATSASEDAARNTRKMSEDSPEQKEDKSDPENRQQEADERAEERIRGLNEDIDKTRKAYGDTDPLARARQPEKIRTGKAAQQLGAGEFGTKDVIEKFKEFRRAAAASPCDVIRNVAESMGFDKAAGDALDKLKKPAGPKAPKAAGVPAKKEESDEKKERKIAATQGPEIDFPQVHLSDDPEERKWQTAAVSTETPPKPRAARAEEEKKEEGAQKSERRGGVFGGMAGILQSIDKTLVSVDQKIKELLECCKTGGGVGGGGVGGGGGAAGALVDLAKEEVKTIQKEAQENIADVEKERQTKLAEVEKERGGIDEDAEKAFNTAKFVDQAKIEEKNQKIRSIQERKGRARKQMTEGLEIGPPTIDPTADTPAVRVKKRGLAAGAAKGFSKGQQRRLLERAKKEREEGDASLMEAGVELGIPSFVQHKESQKQQQIDQQKAAADDEAKRINEEADKKQQDIQKEADDESAKVMQDTRTRVGDMAGGGAGRGPRPPGGGGGAAAGNLAQQLEDASKTIGQMLTAKLNEGATKFANVFSAEKMEAAGKTFGTAARSQLTAEDMTLKADIGPIQVTLTDNGLLDQLKQGLRKHITEAATNAINARFNSDGTLKTQGLEDVGVPLDRGGGQMIG